MNRAICVQFFISGANGIAKHSGEKNSLQMSIQALSTKKTWMAKRTTYKCVFSRIFYII